MSKEVRQKVVSSMNGVGETVKNIPNALTLYVIFSIAITIIYTIVEMLISTKYQVSHDTLTTCVYGFFGGEVVACALIKIFKLRRKDDMDVEE